MRDLVNGEVEMESTAGVSEEESDRKTGCRGFVGSYLYLVVRTQDIGVLCDVSQESGICRS